MKKNKQHKQFDRGNLKFVYDDVKFDKDIETGAITCTIEGNFVSNWPFKEIPVRVFRNEQMGPIDVLATNGCSVYGYATFTATVNANENDNYDENVGCMIAESKCKSKIYIKAMKLISGIAEETEKEIRNLKNLGAKYLSFYAKEQMHQFKVDYKQNGDQK